MSAAANDARAPGDREDGLVRGASGRADGDRAEGEGLAVAPRVPRPRARAARVLQAPGPADEGIIDETFSLFLQR